jgi:ABC-type transport system involved in multi-copper enzyme maturation permease subunit
MLVAIGLIVLELMVVTAIALFFSTFSTPMLSAAFTFGLWVAGHFSADLRNFEQVVQSPATARLARGLYYLLPNLAAFDVKTQVVHGQPIAAGYVGVTALYGLVYIAVLLTASLVIFSRRDFK